MRLIYIIALALTLAVSACGGDESADRSQAQVPAQTADAEEEARKKAEEAREKAREEREQAKEDVADTIDEYAEKFSEQDYEGVCDMFTDKARKELAEQFDSCEDALGFAMAFFSEQDKEAIKNTDAKPSDVTMRGSKKAIVRDLWSQDEENERTTLVKVNGKWLIDL